MFYRSFSKLRFEMAELLEKGELSRLGIIEPQSIRSALAGDLWMKDEVQLRISEMVALELWIGSWRGHLLHGSTVL